ncbi:hypothetical protein FGB62_262g03 [Gracilaria domingensis]|nr:hypothetical protein FGB62_262g03 [Gracilaria domingensis]
MHLYEGHAPISSPAFIEEEPFLVPDCVEMTWLKKHGHSDGILREREASRVVCIPGLPCGTPGHLLRHCRRGSPLSCQLRTYGDICTGRGDCKYRFTNVSRLRNQYDWSAVKRIEGNGESLQLTSVSVSPDSRRFSTSYAIAHVADWLGGVGLGVVCDYVVVVALPVNDCGRRFWQYVHAVLDSQSFS